MSTLDLDLVGAALGARVTDVRPVAGGDASLAHLVRLSDGRRAFVKAQPGAAHDVFSAEARGLAWLADAHALRSPDVLAVGEGFIALEPITVGRAGPRFDEALGRGLAALHRAGAPAFGLDHDNFVGRLPQANAACSDWATFYRERRLAPLVAGARVQLGADLVRQLDRLLAGLSDRVGPSEPPARLHGDLWSGNLLCDEQGAPCLIDPAVYGGHREIDLAMMRLFGGFGERVFAAYHEHSPLAPGHERRVALYQLYPLLVHVHLFGASYVPAVARALARC